jgi:DNA mismatch repair protein MutS2
MFDDETQFPRFVLPSRARRDLGFDEIEEFLRGSCRTQLGIEAVLKTTFPTTPGALDERLAESLEGRALAARQVHPDFAAVRDLRPLLELIDKEGVLAARELLDVAQTLDGVSRIQDLILSRADEWPSLSARARLLHDERGLSRRISRSFDEQGNLLDEASPALRELRERVRALRADVKGVLEDLIRDFDDRGILRDRNFTLRHDRYVLPVKSEHQSAIEGIVHDASQTGQTVFIEPRAILNIGNRIIFAESAVREEERRILHALTIEVGRHAKAIVDDMEIIGALEAAFVRGLLALLIDGTRPRLVGPHEGNALSLDAARHPLLALRAGVLAREGKTSPRVIANDIRLDGRRALIISGPNAGGKTVALKTVGLVVVMARAGLPVPCASSSCVPLVGTVLATIGDEQSIADDLSSFSGHLEALTEITRAVVEHEKGGALVLLDEICAGTDPNQGAALAQSVLEDLVEKRAVLVVTTHYERLKVLAVADGARNRFRNASFALETSTGRPTFTLHLDSVGTSNALDAARRHGLPEHVIARAETLLDPTTRELQSLLDELAERNAALATEQRELAAQRARAEQQSQSLNARLLQLQDEEGRLRREGARVFLREVGDARRIVAEAIETVQKGADARTLNAISHVLRDEADKVARLTSAPVIEGATHLMTSVKPGTVVGLREMPGVRFDVIEVNGDDVVIARGAMRMKRKLAELRNVDGEQKTERAAPSSKGATLGPDLTLRTSENTIDLRGVRVEDALERLEAFFDMRMKEGHSRVFILHGHGTGMLKKAIRESAKNNKYVESFRAGEKDEGGDAFTVVELAGV